VRRLAETVWDDRRRELLGNLAQPDFLKQLEITLNANHVQFDDLGGVEALRSIYAARNRMFHSHRSSFEHLVVATAKLETLLERMIISLLRWKGPVTSPTYSNQITLKER
jgi:hypothetical protein